MSVPGWNATFQDTDDLFSIEFRSMFYNAILERIGPTQRGFVYAAGNVGTVLRVNQSGVINPTHPTNTTDTSNTTNGSYVVTAVDVNGNETLPSPATTITLTAQQFLVSVQASWSPVGNDANGNPPVGYRIYGAGTTLFAWKPYSAARPYFYNRGRCLLVRLPATATSWIDSGISFNQVDYPAPTTTVSTLPTPGAPTLSVVSSPASLTVRAGDDMSSCFQSPQVGPSYDLQPGIATASIAEMQLATQQIAGWFNDPAVYSTAYAAGPPFLAPIIGTTTVGAGTSAAEYHTICTKTGTTLWRRRRPREISSPTGSASASYNYFFFNASAGPHGWWYPGTSPLTAPDGARANFMVWANAPNPNGPSDGSDAPVANFVGVYKYTAATNSWAPDPTPGARADILDSANPLTGGYYITPGVMQHGDFIGPWIFNEIRDVLNACTTTQGYLGLQNASISYSHTGDLGNSMPTVLIFDNYESMHVQTPTSQSSAGAAYSGATGAIAGSTPNSAGRDFGPGGDPFPYPQLVAIESRYGGGSSPTYSCDLYMAQFNPALMLWGGSPCHVAMQIQYVQPYFYASDANDINAFDGQGQFGATALGWTTWHSYDVAAVSPTYHRFGMDQWGSVTVAPHQPAADPPVGPSSTTSTSGLQLNGVYAQVTWTFAHNSST